MQLFPRKDSSGGDSTIEMMANVHQSSNSNNRAGHDADTHKEVYAAPHDHYLGSPNNQPRPFVAENYPELAPHAGLEAVDPDGMPKYGGVIRAGAGGGGGGGGGGGDGGFFQPYHDSPIPVTAMPASDKKLPPTPNEKKPWHQNWTIRILIIAVAVIIIVGIVVGAVLGTRDSNNGDDDGSVDPAETSTGTTTSAPTSTPTSDPDDGEDDLRMGVTYNATFTMYGTGDGSGGTNCTTPQTSCGFTAIPGFTVGVSTNLFTVINGGTDNPVCGTCWFLETLEDDSGQPFRRNITAIVNEECGGEPDEVCGMETLDDVNPWDGNVNFNLCTDSGARDALFDEDSEIGLAWGRVTRVSCDEWEGDKIEP